MVVDCILLAAAMHHCNQLYYMPEGIAKAQRIDGSRMWFILHRHSPTKWWTMLTYKWLTPSRTIWPASTNQDAVCLVITWPGSANQGAHVSDYLSQSGATCPESLGGIKGFTEIVITTSSSPFTLNVTLKCQWVYFSFVTSEGVWICIHILDGSGIPRKQGLCYNSHLCCYMNMLVRGYGRLRVLEQLPLFWP